jgi:hypothetical protein
MLTGFRLTLSGCAGPFAAIFRKFGSEYQNLRVHKLPARRKFFDKTPHSH